MEKIISVVVFLLTTGTGCSVQVAGRGVESAIRISARNAMAVAPGTTASMGTLAPAYTPAPRAMPGHREAAFVFMGSPPPAMYAGKWVRLVNNTTGNIALVVRYEGRYVGTEAGASLRVFGRLGGWQTVPAVLPIVLGGGTDLYVLFQDTPSPVKQFLVTCVDVTRSQEGLVGTELGHQIIRASWGAQGYSTWDHAVTNFECSAGMK